MRAEAIAVLYGEAMEELSGAITYARCAAKWKTDSAENHKNFIAMANDELRHAVMLRDMSCKEVERARAAHPDNAYICAYHDSFMEHFADEYGHVKQMLAGFAG